MEQSIRGVFLRTMLQWGMVYILPCLTITADTTTHTDTSQRLLRSMDKIRTYDPIVLVLLIRLFSPVMLLTDHLPKARCRCTVRMDLYREFPLPPPFFPVRRYCGHWSFCSSWCF